MFPRQNLWHHSKVPHRCDRVVLSPWLTNSKIMSSISHTKTMYGWAIKTPDTLMTPSASTSPASPRIFFSYCSCSARGAWNCSPPSQLQFQLSKRWEVWNTGCLKCWCVFQSNKTLNWTSWTKVLSIEIQKFIESTGCLLPVADLQQTILDLRPGWQCQSNEPYSVA